MARALFFFDDWALARRDNLTRRLGQPWWQREATYEDPTSETPFSYPTVIYDAQLGRWRMFYLGRQTLPPPGYRRTEWLLTAESADGLTWERPDLTDRVPLPERVRPHEVFDSRRFATGGAIYLDEASRERRFKWLFLERHQPDRPGQRVSRLAYSADGYTWQVDPEVSWHPGSPDPGIFTFYNANLGIYRTACRPKLGDRRIAFVDTHDWRTWTAPEVIFHPDALDPPLSEFYGIAILPYEGMYVGILWIFETEPADLHQQKLEGKVYGQLVYSYDGNRFLRSQREPFLGLNEPDEYGAACIYPSSLILDADQQMRIYSGATKGEHFQARSLTEPRYAAITLHTLRKDGFVFLESLAGAGLLTTRWVRVGQDQLQLNVQAPNGEVRVQLTDPAGTPIPGYTFEECQPFRGDSLAWQPCWRERSGLGELVGKPIRIEIRLYHGRLYAIRGELELLYAQDLR